jgi:hypothetical protein
MITPSSFKTTCTEVFGEPNCEFKEYRDTIVYHYIECVVDGAKVAKLTIRDDDLSTSCWVSIKNECIDVHYNFTLKRRLKQAAKLSSSTRKKLFDIYYDITKRFPDLNSRACVILVTHYLANVEFSSYDDIRSFYRGLFVSITKNSPEIYHQLATDMEEYFHSKLADEMKDCFPSITPRKLMRDKEG